VKAAAAMTACALILSRTGVEQRKDRSAPGRATL
jgi:hypothetical protein